MVNVPVVSITQSRHTELPPLPPSQNFVPFGRYTRIQGVTPPDSVDRFANKVSPALASTRNIPMLLDELSVIVCVDPIVTRPVCATSAAAYGDGGMKKSRGLVAVPYGVDKKILPDPATGT